MKRNLLTLLVAVAPLMCPAPAHSETAVQAWARSYSNDTHARDVGYKAVADGAGNVIVTGETDGGVAGQDILTIKYSGAGVPLWTNRYNGPGNSDDLAFNAAVDGSGNVFVVGTSVGVGSGGDWVTLAYSSAGTPLWTNRYNGPGNGDDAAFAVAVDTGGNVFVTGQSVGVGVGQDFTTIAYSGAGVPLWTNRYNGPASGDDLAVDIAVDGSGHVFVTGYTYYDTSFDDYTTIAYSTAGATLWVRHYNGPGNGYDQPTGLAVDGSGNVYVTGYSDGGPTHDDYTTIAYSAAGTPLWTNRYDGPAHDYDEPYAIATDSSGNVFVTGAVNSGAPTGYDVVTLKYSSAGVPLWTNRYNGPANGDDEGFALAVDASGNVFVLCLSQGVTSDYDYATIGYANDGMTRWIARYNGPGNGRDQPESVAVTGSGNVFVTGLSASGTSDDFATIAYSVLGVALWTNRYDGPGNSDDAANAVAVDGSGRVIVTGFSMSATNGYDYATVAYSSTGVPLWTNRYNGAANDEDMAVALGVDGSGNVVVTGHAHAAGLYADYATIKYSSAGSPLWTNTYNGPANLEDDAVALAVDGSGNVAVTGYSNNGSDDDYATIKYSSAGVPLWTNRYNGPDNGNDDAQAVAFDPSGNVVVTGTSLHNHSYDYLTIKYSGAGVGLWTNYYDGGQTNDDNALAMAVDAGGNVYVTGFSLGTSTAADYATVKYSSTGALLWANRYNGPANATDVAEAVAVDASGNVYVTGYSRGIDSGDDYATIAYSAGGVPLWTNRYNGPGNATDQALAVAVDTDGRVFVTGYSTGSGGNHEFATVAYSAAGEALWTNRYSTPFGGDSQPRTAHSLAVASSGSIVVVGRASSAYGSTMGDFASVKYVTVPLLGIRLTTTNTALVYWPNPSADFALEQNSDLNTSKWTSPSEAVNSNGTSKFIIVNPPTGKRFYRLVTP